MSLKKRILISEVSDPEGRKNVLLNRLINFGPITLKEFNAMGITWTKVTASDKAQARNLIREIKEKF